MWKHLFARQSGSFCYNFLNICCDSWEGFYLGDYYCCIKTDCIIPEGRPWSKGLDKFRENISGPLYCIPTVLYSLCLHGCFSPKIQAMSVTSNAFALYQARFSVSYFEFTGNPETFSAMSECRTLHLDAGAPVPRRIQGFSSHTLSLQVMFSPGDPQCQASSARRGGSCDLTLVMYLPELITQSCRALLRCFHLLPKSAEAGIRLLLWTQHGSHWSSFWKSFISPWLAQIALLFKTSRLFKILPIIMCSLKLPDILSSEKVKNKSCEMLTYGIN